MKTNTSLIQPLVLLGLITAILLMIPLVAMQYTDEVVWTGSDFVFAGILLLGTGLAYILISRKSANLIYRIAVGLALASGLFLIWSNGAVGLIGNESEPANLMYFGVIALGLLGGFACKFSPRGLERTMYAIVLSFVVITGIALSAGMQHYPESSVTEIVAVNGLFITLFLLAGLLFRQAVGGEPETGEA